jgi:alkylated DNA repair dioxygenase AlkB
MSLQQLSFFSPITTGFPEGFSYREKVISPEEAVALMRQIDKLPFTEFEFQGYKGKRRVVSFGWQYDFNVGQLKKSTDIPDFLLALRERVTSEDLDSHSLEHVLVTEYAPGAGIGWHKDRPVFEDVIGLSLGTPCLFRLRRKEGDKWHSASLQISPCSVYRMSGPVRWEWEHNIPPVDQLRYSVTFRNFR